MTRIVAVVVTYNRCDLLLQCLAYLNNQQLDSSIEFDAIIVDNASTDNTREAVLRLTQEGFPQPEAASDMFGVLGRILYYNTGENLGGAGGFAYGMRLAVEAGYDYMWVMDDDCLPDSYALQAFLDVCDTRDEAWGYLSSVVRWKDGSPCAMNIQRHPLYRNITDFSSALQPCTLASFVSLFVPSDVVREVGLPHAAFFIWSDDWEFTRRISRRRPCYVVGASTAMHASTTNNPGNIFTDPPERLDRYAYIYRNDVVLYREEGLQGIVFVWTRAIYHSVRVLFSGVGQKRQRVSLIWRGTYEGFSFSPAVEYPM